mmetsp:Transcript_6147/g.6704  ORF Transcript_6147/g.6704 Transcript_6147/m.6704 type:complete len:145 (-) Transcript_6147:90-524(-)
MKPVVPKPDRIDGWRARAGCLLVSADERRVLLISSSSNRNKFIIPAGALELDEFDNPMNGATRETYEEAGVKGSIVCTLGVFENHKKKTRTHFYGMHVEQELKDFPESTFRSRKWFDVSEALKQLEHRPLQQSVLKRFISQRNT